MSRFDRALKDPYELITTRFSQTRGSIGIIYNKNTEIYLVGIGLTLENVKEGGPYGVRESRTREDALNEMYNFLD